MSGRQVKRFLSCAAVGLLASGCLSPPDPGEFGRFRYVGNVRGATPLALIPPISDRDGNAYVLFGDLGLLETELFVGGASGGWSGGCNITFGNQFGVHGFVGRSQSQAWYWSGDALVGAVGQTGVCYRVLEFDPSSGARLAFRAVVPWVRETPSHTTTLAFIQSPTDPRPFSAVIDLERNVYTNLQGFEPGGATDVQFLATGGSLAQGEGVVIVRYTSGGSVRHEARFIDFDGNEIGDVSLSGLDTLPPYGFVGYIHGDDSGLYAGLDVEGQVLVFDASGGKRKTVSGMTPVGVHEWEGRLYVVGESGGRAKIAAIDTSGSIESARTWDSAEIAEDNLGSSIDVVDDRSLPSRITTWKNPRTAMGSELFVHSHRLDHYADGTATWLIAGPSFMAGGEDRTAIAYVPVGISYEE